MARGWPAEAIVQGVAPQKSDAKELSLRSRDVIEGQEGHHRGAEILRLSQDRERMLRAACVGVVSGSLSLLP